MPSTLRLLLVPAALLAIAGCELRPPSDDGAASSAGPEAVVIAEGQRNQAVENSARAQALEKENRALKAKISNQEAALQERQGSSLGSTLSVGGLSGTGFETTSDGAIALSDDFAFAKGKAELTSDGHKAIKTIAAKLNEGDLAGAKVIVEGHTDDTKVSRASTKERFGDNWGLSAARAAAVVTALEEAGVKADRLRGAFRGEHAPRVTGSDKAKNRRVEIRVQR